MEKRKTYHIPRKVNEGYRLLGMGTKEMLLMIPFIFITAMIDFFTPFPMGAKIVITTFLLFIPYGLFTLELGSGLMALEHVKLQLKFMIFDQNDYHLTSSKTRSKEFSEIPTIINRKRKKLSSKILAEQKEIVVSEWEKFQKNEHVVKNEFEGLEDYQQWLAKPKTITKVQEE